MRWRNTTGSYGFIAILLHWLLALLVLGQFALGLYMVGLDYYDPWYHRAPAWHNGLGVLIAGLFLMRFIWRLSNPLPQLYGVQWEQRAARLAHRLFYLLIALIVVSGYLIATAENQALDVFGLFSIPASVSDLPAQADVAGLWHRWLAWLLVGLTALHALAALKHHYMDRDSTLRRILGRP